MTILEFFAVSAYAYMFFSMGRLYERDHKDKKKK